MLEVTDVHAYRGQNYVLQGVSLVAPSGTCTTILGRNGMGKTTLIRTLMGLNPAASGKIVWNGHRVDGLDPYRIARLGLGLVPQGRHVFASLTVEENLTLNAPRRSHRPRGQAAWTLERIYSLFPQLFDRRDNRGNQLSGGEQQMLAIGRALSTNPRMLLMDEPSEGLAPVVVNRVAEVIETLRSEKIGILLVEQHYSLGTRCADNVYIIAKGRVVWEGTASELDSNDDVKSQHLGV